MARRRLAHRSHAGRHSAAHAAAREEAVGPRLLGFWVLVDYLAFRIQIMKSASY